MSFTKSAFLTALTIVAIAAPASGANEKQSPEQLQKDSLPVKQNGGEQYSRNRMMHWLMHSCHHLVTLIHTKSKVINKLEQSIQKVRNDKDLTEEMKAFQIHTFEIFKKELNESENSIFTSIGSLKRALTVSQSSNVYTGSLLLLDILSCALCVMSSQSEYGHSLSRKVLLIIYRYIGYPRCQKNV